MEYVVFDQARDFNRNPFLPCLRLAVPFCEGFGVEGGRDVLDAEGTGLSVAEQLELEDQLSDLHFLRLGLPGDLRIGLFITRSGQAVPRLVSPEGLLISINAFLSSQDYFFFLWRWNMADAVKRSRQVDAISWALFFIWIGVAIWTEVRWAWSLLGISAIVLGAQAALYAGGDRVEGFWVACGLVLLASGVWMLFGLTWPLTPVLLVLLGVAMLGNALFGSHAH